MPRASSQAARSRSVLCVCAVALVALVACQGAIGEPPFASGDPGGDPFRSGALRDPGRVTMHRLNRVEYNNTVRDLLGTSLTPADDFPSDDRGYGFDNIADVLSMSPVLFEMYDRAAEQLVDAALGDRSASGGPLATQIEAESVGGAIGTAAGSAWNLFSNGEIESTVTFPAAGDYKVTVRAWGQQAGPEPARMSVSVGGVAMRTFDVTATSSSPGTYEVTGHVEAGPRVVSVAFLNDYYNPTGGEDRNLIVDWFRVEGPMGAVAMTGSSSARDRIMTCDPASAGRDACASQIVRSFGKRAWRRPLTDAEVADLLRFVPLAEGQGDDFETGIRLALEAILVSPHFVFRVEIDPSPGSLRPHPLSDYELASRLSYFLWSSMPDDALFEAADAGLLQDPNEMRSQVLRMLDDPKAVALIDNFAGQWLYTRALADHEPDYGVFPDWDDSLRDAMRGETETLFREVLQNDLPLDQLLTASFTFVNERLAAHYGISGVTGSELRRVSLPAGANRVGLLGHGSILTVTSYPARTSPVRRGKWILEQLLCAAPPPPPADVPSLEEESDTSGSIRDRMERHRTDPVCVSCHSVMDPLGFALEHYDGIGAYRVMDGEYDIDATGTLPTGEPFDGAIDLAQLLAGDERFARCATRHLYTYALGRGPEDFDAQHIDDLTAKFADSGYLLRELIVAIATSEPFRLRRGEAGGAP